MFSQSNGVASLDVQSVKWCGIIGYEAGNGTAGETMISGYTGEAFRTDIFIGPVYYQRLRHMVSDKFQVTSHHCFPIHGKHLSSF